MILFFFVQNVSVFVYVSIFAKMLSASPIFNQNIISFTAIRWQTFYWPNISILWTFSFLKSHHSVDEFFFKIVLKKSLCPKFLFLNCQFFHASQSWLVVWCFWIRGIDLWRFLVAQFPSISGNAVSQEYWFFRIKLRSQGLVRYPVYCSFPLLFLKHCCLFELYYFCSRFIPYNITSAFLFNVLLIVFELLVESMQLQKRNVCSSSKSNNFLTCSFTLRFCFFVVVVT